MTRARLWILRLSTALLFPVLLLAGCEGLLRLFSVGDAPGLLLPCRSNGREALCDNARFTKPFFPPGAARAPPAFAIPEAKAPGTFRVFVLGESAALGDPEPAYGFSRYLEVLLRERHPGLKLEVVNASTTAINSHLLLPMARELVRLQPDLFIVYAGNNEVVGPFGSGTVLTSRAPPLWLIRARVALEGTRLGRLLGRAVRSAGRAPVRGEWRGMEMFLGQQVPADAPGLARVRENFGRNLRDLLAAARVSGARVVVSTVATNLRDSAPFASVHGAGLSGERLAAWESHERAGVALEAAGKTREAIAEWRQAEAIDGRHAGLQFRLGRALLAAGDAATAREKLLLARELDALRFRADASINQMIREEATSAGQGVELVDAAEAFAANSLDGIPGSPLFWEHVHLTPEGNDLLARTLLPAVERALPPSSQATPSAPLLSTGETHRLLGLGAFERRRLARELFRRMEAPPFSNQLDHAARLAELHGQGEAAVEPAAESVRLWREALARAPDDPLLALGLATFLAPTEPQAALALLPQVVAALPTHPGARELLAGVLGRLGRHEEAVAEVHHLLQMRPDFPPAFVDLGYLEAQRGAFDAAVVAYRRGAYLAPSLAPGVLAEVGRIRGHQGRWEEAVEAFQEAAAAAEPGGSEQAELRVQQGLALRRMGLSGESRRVFTLAAEGYRAWLTREPRSGGAEWGLSRALAEAGELQEALAHLRSAVALDPAVPELRSELVRALESLGRSEEARAAAVAGAVALREAGHAAEADALDKKATALAAPKPR